MVKYTSQEELDDFQTEINILATCHHKNVLKLYDAYWWKDHFYVRVHIALVSVRFASLVWQTSAVSLQVADRAHAVGILRNKSGFVTLVPHVLHPTAGDRVLRVWLARRPD